MPTAQFLPRDSSPRDAKLACGMSMFLPGLGQLYNQEPRKATLFFAAGAVNYLFIFALLLMTPLMHLLKGFGESNQVRLNSSLVSSLSNLHAGSGAFFILLSLFFAFALFAARDAYDKAQLFQRKALYRDHVLEMPEAASGSYLFHISILLSCLILAFFFLIPPAPREQMTVFEFKQSVENAKVNKEATKFSNHAARAGGVRDLRRPTAVAQKAATAPAAAPKPILQAIAPPQAPTPEAKPAARPPAVHPLLPTPSNSSLSPANRPVALAPQMMPSAPVSNHQANLSLPVVTTSGASSFRLPQIVSDSSTGPVKIASALPSGAGSAPNSDTLSPVPVGARTGLPSHSSSSFAPAPAPAPVRASNSSGSAPRGPGVVGPVLHQGGREETANSDGGKEKEGIAVVPVDFGAYMTQLQARIKRSWFPPKIGRSKRVKVIFNISRDGQLSRLRLVNSSGLTASDQAALKAVEAAAPFMPLPKGAPADVDIEFTFDYNVFNGLGAERLN